MKGIEGSHRLAPLSRIWTSRLDLTARPSLQGGPPSDEVHSRTKAARVPRWRVRSTEYGVIERG